MRLLLLPILLALVVWIANPSRLGAQGFEELALVSLKAPAKLRLSDRHKLRIARVVLRVANRGASPVVIADPEALNAALRLVANPLEGLIFCAVPEITPRLRVGQRFPLRIEPGKRTRIEFEVEITCGSNSGSEPDWEFTARVGGTEVEGEATRFRSTLDVDDTRSSTRLLLPGPYDVGTRPLDLVDASRPTMPNGDFEGADERSLPTRVWYPAPPGRGGAGAPLERSGAPYPFIVFSHGLGSPNNASIFLMNHLASHGYVVAAPAFPLSRFGAPGGQTVADQPAQAGDVSFLIDTFRDFSNEPGNFFADGIDIGRVGLTGHSNGGITTLITTYDQNLRDPRVKAAMPMSPGACFFQPGYFGDIDVPLLILHGENDLFVDFAVHAQAAFDRANPQKSLVAIERGNHLGFSDAGIAIDDAIGCMFVPDEETLAAQGEALLAAMGGEGSFFSAEGCDAGEFCVGDSGAIDGRRQQQIAKQAGLAFFESVLRGDASAASYLFEDLELLNPDLTHQSELSRP